MSNSKYSYYKENKGDKVWWLDNYDVIGQYIFSFDKKKQFNLFRDYPHRLSAREWLIFNKENPYWVKFFRDRNEEYYMKHNDELMELLKDNSGELPL